MIHSGPTAHLPPTVVLGQEALNLANDAQFAAEWRSLYDACPWATTGQHPGYVATHWRIYHDLREPVLIYQRDDAGALVGLLALYRDGQKLVGGGGDDCEYHVWLSSPEQSSAFMSAAVTALRTKVGSYELFLEYIPPEVPMDWAEGNSAVSAWCDLIPVERRIIRTQPGVDVLNNFHGKTRLKREYKRLEQEGPVTFRFVTEAADYERILDGFVPLFDFRKGAMYGEFAFRNHPRRRKVLRELFDVPGVLCVAVLERDGKLLTAHIGVDGNRETFTLGGSAHDEFYAKYSTGMILQMHLFRAIHKRGYSVIDLTPGDDQYKVHWGNDVQTVHRLHVQTSTIGQGVGRIRRLMKASVRSVLNHLPAKEDASSEHVAASPPTISVPLYKLKDEDTSAGDADQSWNLNSIPDVLAHPTTGSAYWMFLRWVHQYIRDGASLYTRTTNGKLSEGWLLLSVEDALGDSTSADRPPAEKWLLVGMASQLPASGVDEAHSLRSVLAALKPEVRNQLLLVISDPSPDRTAERLALQISPGRIPMTTDGRLAPPLPGKTPPREPESKKMETA